MRLRRRGLRAVGTSVTFSFDGETIPAVAGETIAAAMAAAGRPAVRHAGDTGGVSDWRGPWCGMGSCFDCVVTVDGRAGQRACLTKIEGGEVVRSGAPAGTVGDPLKPLSTVASATPAVVESDVLVVGAGPAGLCAALAARRAGARVHVLDERSEPGGQYFKPVAGAYRAKRPLDGQFRRGERLRAQVDAAGVKRVQSATVWGADHPGEVLALVDGCATLFRQRALVLATGAYERAAPLPGWTLPGVMTTGAAQTLARSQQVAPGARVVVAGNGPLNFQLAADLVAQGIEVVALAESARAPTFADMGTVWAALREDPANMVRGAGYLATLRRARVPILWSHVATAAKGTTRVEAIDLQPVGEDGVAHANAQTFEADAVCLGYGFVASTELAVALGCATTRDRRHFGTLSVVTDDDGATSVDGVFAAGDGAMVAGAAVAEARGTLAGTAAARFCGFTPQSPARAARAARKAARFQAALWTLFRAPPVRMDMIADETVLCRCEALRFGAVRREIAAGAASLAVLKRRLRLGMGRCQGRMCTPAAARLLTETTGRDAVPAFAPRLPVKPFPAGALALEKPEWGGHQRAGTPNLARAVAGQPCPPDEADVVVIGGGVVGACLAYELSAAGMDVLVVERDDVNLQASGSNAGSLHIQLLSFDFGEKAEAGGGPAAQTLPLGPFAVALWEELAQACGQDFEIRKTGGLMVASTAAGMRFLEEKAAFERRFGIDAHIISAADLQRLAPALSPALVGAEYVPDEGKINPLTATYSVMNAAKARGARVRTSANVTGLSRGANGWTVETTRGPIRCGRVVNAAGPWAGPVAALAGINVPVHSAPLQMIVTERAPKLVDQLVAHADRHLSLKQLSSGGLVIGGAWPGHYDASKNINRTMRESVEGNLWVAQEVLPQLSGLHVLRTWAGMNVNIDGAPIVGEAPGMPGFFNCVTSNGYTLAPAVARLTAELMVDGRTSFDIAPYRLERF